MEGSSDGGEELLLFLRDKKSMMLCGMCHMVFRSSTGTQIFAWDPHVWVLSIAGYGCAVNIHINIEVAVYDVNLY